jgi:Na+/melibiose symporter-like transporter
VREMLRCCHALCVPVPHTLYSCIQYDTPSLLTRIELDAATDEFPVWWFGVIASINVLNWLFATPLWAIVWPKAIGGMFGYGNKAVALSLADTIGVIVGFANPFIGSLSDRLPDRWAAKWGRRRPFVLIGSILMGTGVWLTYVSLYWMRGKPNAIWVLLISLVMGNSGSALALVPFGAILTETISPKQRGISIVINTWLGGACTLVGWGIGWMIGEGIFFTTEVIWWLNILKFGFQMPVLMIACGGTAGCCTPERKRVASREEKKAAKALIAKLAGANADGSSSSGQSVGVVKDAGVLWNRSRTMRWDRRQQSWLEVRTPGCGERMTANLIDFSSAFREPAFRWLWIQLFVATIGNTFVSAFCLCTLSASL